MNYMLDVGKLVGTRGHYVQIMKVGLANERLTWRQRAIVHQIVDNIWNNIGFP